ncbi:hypothetical protein BEN48_10600 [Hymenobacter glacialis]|uniref:DUF11 domain-containing protein n=1 Tax=Hymenobacter glacialis TaxID=1908236 RepID=A0A1G1TAW4_9BACT|nr:hypothetical protein BEN48_10600 [Hymenobacter glacialis]
MLCLLAGSSAWAGTGVQRIQNGNFSRYPVVGGSGYPLASGIDLGAWRSGVPYVNTGTRPALGQVSIQRAAANYTGGISTVQNTFPGDNANGVLASTTWLLYRGTAPAAVWYQTAAVRPGTTYTFSYYASNANAPGTTTTPVPVLQFQLNGVAQGSNATLANEAVGSDVWTRYTYTFTTGASQTEVELRLVDLTAAGTVTSDQVALTGLSLRAPSADAGPSYSCDGSFYQARQVNTAPANGTVGNSTRLFEVIRSTTPYTTTQLQDLGGTFNAVGYNSLDGYLYALTYTGNVSTGTDATVDRASDPTSVVELVKIGATGVESLGVVSGLPVDQWAAGTFDRNGNLFVKAQTNTSVIYRINLSSLPLTATALTTSTAFTAFDLAFNPIDSQLYGTFFPGQLFIVNPTSGAVTTIGSVTDATQALGSAFFDIVGNLYAYGNGPTPPTTTSGRFYVINKTSGAATQINTINGATNSDGASCINPLQRIDVVKSVTSVVPVAAGQYDITYVVQVKNTGTVTDLNVQVSDFLRGNASNTTFPTSTALTLQSIAVQNFDGAALVANTGFTGVTGGASLLTGTQSLSPNQRATITFTVRVTFPSGSVPATAQNNTAYATSTSTGPNNGYTQLTDGTLLTPIDLVANDASTNSSVLPPNRSTTSDPGDSPSPTPVTFQPAIFGSVFEDVNYGGGAGRDLPASQGVSRSGARVELYSSTGAFISATTTDASGNYSFPSLTAGATYSVRVVNSTVSSSRTGYVSGLLPVQTFVNTNGNRVGGENPQRIDAGSNTTSATLASLDSAPNGTIAQSVATFTLSSTSASPTVNVNFGFNFNTIVNTTNAGQGSLRQFILNSNALGGETALAQSGSDAAGALPAGVESSIFMISNGTAVPGLRAGLTNQLSTAGVAVITPATALPAITGPGTSINGSTQTANVGNTNNVTLGAGGTVGTASTALGTVNGPEVQLVGTSAIGVGLDIAAGSTGTQVLGLALYGFGNAADNSTSAEIRVAAGGVTISRNVIGTSATSFMDLGTARGLSDGIRFTAGTTASTVSNNLIGFNSGKGITTMSGVTNVTIANNEIRSNGLTGSTFDGVDIQGSASTVTNNLLINNAGTGVDGNLSAGSITIAGNTVSGNGRGTATLAPAETAGLRLSGASNSVSLNIISGNYGAGVQVQSTSTTTVLSQNSIFNNGTVAAANGAAATGQLGIDLNTGADAGGTSPYVTVNDLNDADGGANGLLNFPVITSATIVGSNLVVQGFARPGSVIEFFNPGATADPSGFGEGQTFLGSFSEGSAADLNTGTGSYSGLINGLNQGTDNTNRFTFSIPLTGNFASYALNSLLTSTATLANATSEFSGNVVVNAAPVPNSVTNNVAIPNTSIARVLNPNLSATTTGSGNAVSFFTLISLPTSGTLTYNGTVMTAANIATTQITPALLGTLTYTPMQGFKGGSVSFTYTVTDANGITSTTNNTGGTTASGPATYTIPVSDDTPAVYTLLPPSGGQGNPYPNGSTLATVLDVNGATYNSAGTLTYNGIVSAVLTAGSLPVGTALNSTTGAITVIQANQLVPGNYPLTIVTTDAFGGVTTHTITLIIGASPIAVDDFASTLPGVAVTFSATDNDLPNGGPNIQANTLDLDPNTPGIQTTVTTAQGTFTTANSSSGSVTFTPAPGFTGVATLTYVVQNNAGALTNQANLVVTVAPVAPADLSTTISASANPVNAGATETLTMVATNNSATTATGVVQTVSIPAGLTAASLTVGGQTGTLSGSTITFANGASYNTTTGLVTFAATTLNARASQTFMVAFAAPAAGPFTATAQVGNGMVDPNPANNTASVLINVTPQFDLSTAITGPASVVAGNLAIFAVLTTNNGPSTAVAAIQTVQLPANLSGVFATNGGSYNSGTGVVTFPAVVLASGQTVNNTVSFAAPTSSFTASATVTPNTNATGDTNPANNTATAPAMSIVPATGTPATSTQPLAGTVANTYVTISGPTTAQLGQTGLTYTITQGNDGPTAASNVLTQVSLPAGLSGVSVSNGGTYNSTTGVVTFPTLATQASSASQTYTVTLTAPATGSVVMVSASTASATTDPMPGNNVASMVTNLTPNTDVAAAISGPATVVAGQVAAYTVTLRNVSTTPASTVVGTVQLVAGLTASDLRLSGQTGTLSGSTITFASGATYNTTTGLLTLASIATLAPNTEQTFAIAFTAPAQTSLSASVRVTTATAGINLANNASATTATVTPAADVAVQVSGPAMATAGNLVTYTVNTSNNGPSPAASVTTTVQLPTGLNNVSVRDNTGTVLAGAYNATTGVVTFPTVTNLQVGVVSERTGTVSFESPNAVRVDVTALAAVSDATGDFFLANNTATTVTALNPAQGAVVDLQATLTANVTTQAVGQPVTFTLTTRNLSPIDAQNVSNRVVLPAAQTVASLQVNGASGTLSGNTIVFANAVYDVTTGVLSFTAQPSLVANGTITNTITVVAPGYTPLVATATVRADNPENVLTNNVATAIVNITTQADVATTVSGPATTVAGATVTYTTSVVNNGPANATGVATSMTLPAGATNVVLPAGATQTGNVVTFATISTLLPGAANTVTSAVTFTAPAPAYTVTSTVSSTSTDPNAGNNSSSTSTTLANLAPVALYVVNTLQSPEGNTAMALPIAPLSATDADGSIVSYTILALPPASQGVLFVNGVALTAASFPGLVLTAAQAAQLQFDPAAGYVGNVSFLYTATDNGNGVEANALTSAAALYALAVGQDNASVYTNTPVRGGATPYVNSDVISNVFDTNGGAYSVAAAITDNGVRSAVLDASSNPLPAGVSLNPTTGQLFVSNANALVAGLYTVTITTTDVFGGITTQPVTFRIGNFPLPVELAAFTATAVNADALLKWTTASEKNNAYFDVERSLNGTDFVKIGQVKGQGNSSASTDYALTDAGIGAKATGLVYYRLKQVDVDGTASFSPVRTLAFAKVAAAPAIALYPNPATASTQLDLTQLPAGAYQVSILDATGRVVLNNTLGAGSAHALNLNTIASGTYMVLVRGQNNGQIVKLTKRLIKE